MGDTPAAGLTAHPLFFELQAVDPLWLHAHSGSALRGMVYRAVAELAGSPTDASELRFTNDVVLQRLLSTLNEDNSRGMDVPRPYVIEPPPPYDADLAGSGRPTHMLAPGQAFTFGVTLFGKAMEAFPILIMAVKRAEERGLGRFLPANSNEAGHPTRGRFRLVRAFAQNPLTRTSQEFLAAGERRVMVPLVSVTPEDVRQQATLDAEARPTALRLRIHTPMTLKAHGEVLRQPNFSVLIHRLIERLGALTDHHGDGRPACVPPDREARNALLKQADAVRLTSSSAKFTTVYGHSDRTRAPTNLSGMLGVAEYAAEDFGPFFELLRWAEICHIGQHTVKGNGLLRVQWLG